MHINANKIPMKIINAAKITNKALIFAKILSDVIPILSRLLVIYYNYTPKIFSKLYSLSNNLIIPSGFKNLKSTIFPKLYKYKVDSAGNET